MLELTLMRHGVPKCDHRARVRGRDFAAWVDSYESAPLDQQCAPPAALCRHAAEVSCIVTSQLRRAIESAALVAPTRSVLNDPLFNEAGLPTHIPFRFALRPGHWDALARVAWMAGWSPGAETFAEASARAVRAADRLVELANTHGSVLLIGHGMLNTLICRVLRRNGWIGSGSPRSYWGMVVLRRQVDRGQIHG
jgi:broad specificity phosphatase PhoE